MTAANCNRQALVTAEQRITTVYRIRGSGHTWNGKSAAYRYAAFEMVDSRNTTANRDRLIRRLARWLQWRDERGES